MTMTSMTDEIETRWQALIHAAEPDQREVDASSPIRMIMGVTAIGSPYFAVITGDKPGQPELGGSVRVERRRRSDSKWVLRLELQVGDLTDPFVSLLSEIAAKCSTASTERSGLSRFLAIVSDWQALLLARTAHITEARLRGLVAELWFGFQSLRHNQSLHDAVIGWEGALGGCQDYVFANPAGSFEVKALRTQSVAVEISSAEQLDGERVHLAAVTLEALAVDQGGFTLPQQVHAIRESLLDGSDRSEFDRRFANLVINLDDPWYREHSFSVRRLQIFDVGQDFPAIRKSQLPPAIPRTKYRIDLSFVRDFLSLDEKYS